MKSYFTKSGLSKWSIMALFCFLVTFMLLNGIKAYNKTYNEPCRVGEFIAQAGGDTPGYINPIEKYIQTGEYNDGSIEEKTVGRGPYYGAYYFIFRQFLPVAKAYDAVVIMQIVWLAVAIILLMLIVEPYIKYKSLVWLIPLIMYITPMMFYTTRVITDSLATSQLICFSFFYVRYNRDKRYSSLFLAALFLAMASVMKPYLLPIYAICFFDWAITNRLVDVKKWAVYVGIMSIPLVLICLPFTVRNAVKLHTFAPMQNTTYGGIKHDKVNAAMRDMVKAWGENHIEWGNELGSFFMPIEGASYTAELPQHIYTDKYDEGNLRDLAIQCQAYQKMEVGPQKDSLQTYLIETMTLYRNSYIAEHPLWRIRATYRHLSILLSPAPLQLNKRHIGLRHYISNGLALLFWLVRWLLLLGGAIGLLLMIKNMDLRFITWITLYIILFFTILLMSESRFFLIGAMFNVIGLIYCLDRCISRIREK